MTYAKICRTRVAYVVGASLPPVPVELRDALRGQLPPYMVPQHIVVLDAMPRLPNGKLNRQALPKPAVEAMSTAMAADDAPQTAAEALLADIWKDVLGLQHIRRSDNFFDLGGHSLLANQVTVAFERASGCRIALRRMALETLAQLTADVGVPTAVEADMGVETSVPPPFVRRFIRHFFGSRRSA